MGREKPPLKDTVKDLIERLTSQKGGDLMAAWERAVGPEASRHSRPVRIDKGRLRVNISDSSRLYEMTLRKKEILEMMNGILGGKKIKEIRFQIGDVSK